MDPIKDRYNKLQIGPFNFKGPGADIIKQKKVFEILNLEFFKNNLSIKVTTLGNFEGYVYSLNINDKIFNINDGLNYLEKLYQIYNLKRKMNKIKKYNN
jgi:hypothetical protein